jgi:hypothetical protein
MSASVVAYFYDPGTGVFTGSSFVGPARMLAANTPPAVSVFDATTTSVDPQSQRVDVVSGELIDYQPPKPDDQGGECNWQWDASSRRWASTLTDVYYWRMIRAERTRFLAQCDYLVLRAQERGEEVGLEWVQYRQALRDITTQADPMNIVWPTKPGG